MEHLVEPVSCAACDLRARLETEVDQVRDALWRAEADLLAVTSWERADARPMELVRIVSTSRREVAALELVLLDIDCGHGDNHAARDRQ